MPICGCAVSMLRAVWRSLAGLFVDDVPYAAAILLWLAITCALLPLAGVKRPALAVAMLLGLLALLVGGAVVRARQSATKP